MLFKAKNFSFPLGGKSYVMGIVNATPDSFCAESRFCGEAAAQRLAELQALGADLVDLGAQSTAPGSTPISAKEERERLLPVLNALGGRLSVALSVDTYFPEIALFALENGADIINFVGGTPPTVLLDAVKAHSAGLILMHTGNPDSPSVYPDGVIKSVKDFFDFSLKLAEKSGLSPDSICLDPGIGFGKTRADDLEILSHLPSLRSRCALLVGASHKRTVRLAGGDIVSASLAAHSAALLGGADIIRVHDVSQSRAAADMIDLIKKGGAFLENG